MSDKTKAHQAESSQGKSSISELRSLGSTSSITIPKSSSVKNIVVAAIVFLGLGGGGYVFSTSETGKSLLGSSPADSEDVAKDDAEGTAPTPGKEGLPPETGAELPKEAALPPQGPNPTAAAPAAPVAEPVKAAIEAPVIEKKAVVSKSATHKKGKAVVSKKAKTKKKKTVAKHKGKKTKAVASKKAKAKKAVPSAQASLTPAHP